MFCLINSPVPAPPHALLQCALVSAVCCASASYFALSPLTSHEEEASCQDRPKQGIHAVDVRWAFGDFKERLLPLCLRCQSLCLCKSLAVRLLFSWSSAGYSGWRSYNFIPALPWEAASVISTGSAAILDSPRWFVDRDYGDCDVDSFLLFFQVLFTVSMVTYQWFFAFLISY